MRPAPALSYRRRVPSAQELDLHGYAAGVDLHHLSHAAVEAAQGRHLQRENVGEAEVVIGDCLTLGPSGQVAAVALALTVPLL